MGFKISPQSPYSAKSQNPLQMESVCAWRRVGWRYSGGWHNPQPSKVRKLIILFEDCKSTPSWRWGQEIRRKRPLSRSSTQCTLLKCRFAKKVSLQNISLKSVLFSKRDITKYSPTIKLIVRSPSSRPVIRRRSTTFFRNTKVPSIRIVEIHRTHLIGFWWRPLWWYDYTMTERRARTHTEIGRAHCIYEGTPITSTQELRELPYAL